MGFFGQCVYPAATKPTPPLRIIANMIELGYAESDLYRVKYHNEYHKKIELTDRSKFLYHLQFEYREGNSVMQCGNISDLASRR